MPPTWANIDKFYVWIINFMFMSTNKELTFYTSANPSIQYEEGAVEIKVSLQNYARLNK